MADTPTLDNVTITTSEHELTGQLVHHPAQNALELMTDEGSERLSVNLLSYGLVAGPDEVWIKDWSEHEDLTSALVDQGLVEIVEQTTVGPFDSRAYLVTVLID